VMDGVGMLRADLGCDTLQLAVRQCAAGFAYGARVTLLRMLGAVRPLAEICSWGAAASSSPHADRMRTRRASPRALAKRRGSLSPRSGRVRS
jgi:hypothetical protein